MPFGLKNVPPTYQWTMSMAFCEYLGVFMKLFLNDFSVFNDLKTYLAKLWLCFWKMPWIQYQLEFGKVHVFGLLMVILGYVISKVGKLPNPKKTLTIVNMLTPKTPRDIQVFNGMAQFYWCFIKNFTFMMAPSQNSYTKWRCLCGLPNVRKCGRP
jgi:hypothetical protein